MGDGREEGYRSAERRGREGEYSGQGRALRKVDVGFVSGTGSEVVAEPFLWKGM